MVAQVAERCGGNCGKVRGQLASGTDWLGATQACLPSDAPSLSKDTLGTTHPKLSSGCHLCTQGSCVAFLQVLRRWSQLLPGPTVPFPLQPTSKASAPSSKYSRSQSLVAASRAGSHPLSSELGQLLPDWTLTVYSLWSSQSASRTVHGSRSLENEVPVVIRRPCSIRSPFPAHSAVTGLVLVLRLAWLTPTSEPFPRYSHGPCPHPRPASSQKLSLRSPLPSHPQFNSSPRYLTSESLFYISTLRTSRTMCLYIVISLAVPLQSQMSAPRWLWSLTVPYSLKA